MPIKVCDIIGTGYSDWDRIDCKSNLKHTHILYYKNIMYVRNVVTTVVRIWYWECTAIS